MFEERKYAEEVTERLLAHAAVAVVRLVVYHVRLIPDRAALAPAAQRNSPSGQSHLVFLTGYELI
jgi:hypothetical protein